MMTLSLFLNNNSSVFIPCRDLTPEARNIYDETGDGPYSTYGGVFGQAFLKSEEGVKASPDIFIGYVGSAGEVPKDFLVNSDHSSSSQPPTESEIEIMAIANVPKPRSRGNVKLDPKNSKNLLIDFNYLSHPGDKEVLIAGIKALIATFEDTPTFQKLGARVNPVPLLACSQFQFRSDDYWKCAIKQQATFGGHPVGTCRMGRGDEDPNAVVDSKLRVIGVQNLRVVDASVIPDITNANIQAPVYAIAEKSAELILEDYK